MKSMGGNALAGLVLMAAVCGGAPSAAAEGFSDHELGDFYPLSVIEDAVVHEVSEAVVRFPTASGFIVSSDGLIMTNHHVYESFGKSGTVWRRWVGDGSEQALGIELVSKDRAHDVALYRVTSGLDAGERLPHIELRNSPARVGEQVFVLGHPDGDPLRASFGTVLATDLHISGRPSIEYSAQTWWGSSGSPVLDRQGRLLAIHWGWDSQGLSNGRLTGVPTTEFMELSSFSQIAAPRPPSACTVGWSIDSQLVRAQARKNASGRWLDHVELRASHADPKCQAALRQATITLHPTFSDPVKRIERDEALTIYSWGFFDAQLDVVLDDGTALRTRDRVAWK